MGLEDGGVSGAAKVGRSDDSTMDAISQQPVALYVRGDDLHFYDSGVFDYQCKGLVNHVVLAVGYGTTAGQNYYNVRNSWGEYWGERGYFRLQRGIVDGAICMLQNSPEYPVLKGDTYCSDSDYSQTWNYGCQGDCGCNYPDGSPKAKCDKCC